ncbi:glutamate decarboxylase [Thamnocephalis sphaerospora]|uniref:Glutamate decarboxylase n=1 Tax=Thamnocephalis sphaerospora TaxID=78915 RepID=A0A4P9XT32_9FUNG|nr:glutamate decarboxylase [Thamnocephalis sphaerospora]|eukprot:RKP08681.1 glutamate decarboxylase [Thamnocephalis sphaerospora]
MLQEHIDPEEVISEAQKSVFGRSHAHIHATAFAARYSTQDVPKFTLPEDGEQPVVAYRIVHDELEMDGRPIAVRGQVFLTTWMEPECEKLIKECLPKNFADMEEYPSTRVIHERCISILADLWHAPKGKGTCAIGTAVVGSSEGVLLAGLAMKWHWRNRMRAAGKDTSNPNIVFGHNVQVAEEKFARYFDVEPRRVPVSAESRYCMDPDAAVSLIDENTIGVIAILGSTYTGHYEAVEVLSKRLDELHKNTGIDVPIHVDAASGGFIAPFVTPNLRWDFKLPRVVSINASGHKFGLVYPGLGWVIWRNKEVLPSDLIFELHYLGGKDYTFTLNFSRASALMVAQYYNFLRLGRSGYTNIGRSCMDNARLLASALEHTKYFRVVSDTLTRAKSGVCDMAGYVPCLPLVAFYITDEARKDYPHLKEESLAVLLSSRGWLLPAYELPPACQETSILRVVVRERLTRDLVDQLVADAIWALERAREFGAAITPGVPIGRLGPPEPQEYQGGYARPC